MDESGTRYSKTHTLTKQENIAEQIKKFHFIMEGLRFYVDCQESSLAPHRKAALKNEYLNSSFLDAPAPTEPNSIKERPVSVSRRDVEVFWFIETYIKFHGFSPLLTEIANEIGTSKQSVSLTISRLEKMGCIKRIPRNHRGIVPIKSPISLK